MGSLMILTSVLSTGCMQTKVRMGTLPDVAALESSLRVGESTQDDVHRVLGPPFGEGRAMLPIQTNVKAIWTYWYEEGTTQDSRRILLFVFFDEDRYGGYMWASSLPIHAKRSQGGTGLQGTSQ
jgi:hypothetical protein